LLSITEFTQVRSPTNVMSVGKPLVRAPTLFYIRESTLERDPTHVMIVLKVLVVVQIS
jgi:hypothetical protein